MVTVSFLVLGRTWHDAVTFYHFYLLPSPLSLVHTSNNVEATLSNATSRTILSTKSDVASTLLPFLATLPNKILSFRNMFSLFWLCRKDEISFDIVAKNGNIIAKTATMSKQHSILSKGRYFTINSFDIVAVLATKSNVVSTKSNVASTLLLVWTGFRKIPATPLEMSCWQSLEGGREFCRRRLVRRHSQRLAATESCRRWVCTVHRGRQPASARRRRTPSRLWATWPGRCRCRPPARSRRRRRRRSTGLPSGSGSRRLSVRRLECCRE